MRYESFYPFAQQQPTQYPTAMNQQPGFGMPSQMGHMPMPQPPFQQEAMHHNGYGGQMAGGQMPGGQMPGGQMPNGQEPTQGNSRLDAYMQTANNFLNTAQQFAPVVQQFAPMVQNLPAMWKLYKGFASLPTQGAAGAATSAAASAASAGATGTSIPRVFQPPNV